MEAKDKQHSACQAKPQVCKNVSSKKRCSLSALDDIRPTEKRRVRDLVHEAGIDVSDWANFLGGQKKAAANPKYCYEWAFQVPDRLVVLNLWNDSLKFEEGKVIAQINPQEFAAKVSRSPARGKGVLKARAARLDQALREAWQDRLPVRIIVNRGRQGDIDDPSSTAARVQYRLLDPVPWRVTTYASNGDATIVRGVVADRFVDQFSTNVNSERRAVSGEVFVRDRALRDRCLRRARGFCEYCAAPGFRMKDGSVYLETHHVIPLSESGPDAEDNVAALCANHHREAHYGAQAVDIRATLLRKLRPIR